MPMGTCSFSPLILTRSSWYSTSLWMFLPRSSPVSPREPKYAISSEASKAALFSMARAISFCSRSRSCIRAASAFVTFWAFIRAFLSALRMSSRPISSNSFCQSAAPCWISWAICRIWAAFPTWYCPVLLSYTQTGFLASAR